jgi:uncharacterized repeat protein (TIGR03803 family)
VGCEVCRGGFDHAVAEGGEIQACEHRLAASEQDGRKCEMQFIDEFGLQVLANGRDAAADLDVTCARGVACALEGRVDAVGNEVECGAAFHGDRGAGVVGEDEGGGVIGGIVAPPAFPAVVGPFAAHGAEHVPAQDEGTEAVHGAVGKIVVHAFRAAGLAGHGLEALRWEEPAVEFRAALAQGILQALFRAGAEPVQGDGEPCHSDTPHHGIPPLFATCYVRDAVSAIRECNMARAILHFMCLAAFAVASPARSQTVSTLYTFKNGSDANLPNAPLDIADGMLFGTSETGGATNNGTVFRVDAATGEEHLVYSFGGGSGGDAPMGSAFLHDGALYGTTTRGGAAEGGVAA